MGFQLFAFPCTPVAATARWPNPTQIKNYFNFCCLIATFLLLLYLGVNWQVFTITICCSTTKLKSTHWCIQLMDDSGAMCLLECDGGRRWTNCGGCVATCANYNLPVPCPFTCHIGCRCPPNLPVWHGGRCIAADQCPGSFLRVSCNFWLDVSTVNGDRKSQSNLGRAASSTFTQIMDYCCVCC